jgi:uncharacterized protein (DUF58 family)
MLPAEIVRQVRRIQVRTGRQVADVLAGAYVSVFKGRGMEFDEVRPYVPGDDVRTIDWNVTARTGVPFVKRFVEERELTVMLVVDVSGSMAFGSAHRSKREAATELSALVAFSAIQNDDKVGLLLFSGGTEKYIPPRKGQKHAMRVVREVLARGAERGRRRAQATDIGAAIEHCRRALPRRAVVFVISDFIDEGFMLPLRTANRRHDVVAVLVSDRRETEPVDAGGLLTLEDPETGALALVDTSSAAFREAAAATARGRVARLEGQLRSSGIDLIEIDAAGSVVEPLVQFFRMRERRARR